jgi:4-amino-4-deoxy-L-arabinose transferase-like glycosyltransferase
MQAIPRPRDLDDAAGGSGWADRSAAVLIAAIVGLAAVRLWLAGTLGLTDDEAYYRLWALAPAMSYYDHPPMVGWMIAAGRWIAGDNPLGIRFISVLVSLIGPFVLWRTATILFGPSVGRRAVWIALAMPLLAVGGVIITPDTPSVLFWGLTGWALAELYVSRHANWWLVVGVFAGLGLISKYSNLFVGAGILLWLVLVRANRSWFLSWQLWAGGAVACLLALPVVLWNAEHEWASMAKQFGRVAHGHKLTGVYFAELVGGALGLLSPVIAVLAVLGLVKVVRSAASAPAGDQASAASALVGAGMLPFLAYLLVHATHNRVQANWMAPLYPSFALCAAVALGGLETPRRVGQSVGRLGRWAIAVGFLLSGLLYWHTVRPFAHLPGQRDPTSQTRGWSALAADVERLRTSTGACWVATSSYATTGQLAYHLKGQAPVVQLTDPIRYIHLPRPDAAVLACPALYVELERRSSPQLLRERFRSVDRLENLTRSSGGVALGSYTVYLAAGGDPAAVIRASSKPN